MKLNNVGHDVVPYEPAYLSSQHQQGPNTCQFDQEVWGLLLSLKELANADYAGESSPPEPQRTCQGSETRMHIQILSRHP